MHLPTMARCRASLVWLLAFTASSLAGAAPIVLQRVYSGPTVHAFALAASDWCKEEVTLVLFGPSADDFLKRDQRIFGYQAEIAAAVRKKCPQMATAVVYGVIGTLDALRPLPGGYIGKLDDHPRVMLDYQYFSRWEGETVGVPLPSYVLRDADRGQVVQAEKSLQAEKLARQKGELIAPSKEQMQGYITQFFARMADTDDYSGDVVTKRLGHTVLALYTTTVENLECTRTGGKYLCAMSIRSSTGPSFFLREQSAPTLHSVSDVCSWKARQLFCDELEKLVADAIAERKRAASATQRRSGSTSSGSDLGKSDTLLESMQKQADDNYYRSSLNPFFPKAWR